MIFTGKAENSSENELVAERVDTIEALGIICDLLSDAMTELLLQDYKVHVDSIIQPTASTALKRKADWETALEVRVYYLVTKHMYSRATYSNCFSV